MFILIKSKTDFLTGFCKVVYSTLIHHRSTIYVNFLQKMFKNIFY
jgi:hypothetical protein